MWECGITTYILAIIWLFSILMIIGILNTGRTIGRGKLIVATTITAFFRWLPGEYLQEIGHSFRRNIYIIFPVTIICIVSALIIYLFSYLSRDQPKDQPPKFKEPRNTD